MNIIRQLVQAYADNWSNIDTARSHEEGEEYKAEVERIMQRIEAYYVPRPPGSVTVTQSEYDALVNIYMTSQSMFVLGVSDAALRTLAMQVDRYTEMLLQKENE